MKNIFKQTMIISSFLLVGGWTTVLLGQNNTDTEVYELLKNKCFICHNAGTSHDNMLAPPMMAVKNHYWEDDKEAFINNIVDWVLNPAVEKVQMYGAVERFNIMPKLSYSKAEVERIAAYIFENEMIPPSFCGEGDPSPLEKLTLNNGKKWIVNQATQDGMVKIKGLLTDYVKNEKKDHVLLSQKMGEEATQLINKCDMIGKDHEQLHIILVPIMDTIEEIKKSNFAQPLLDLSVYLGEYFDHFTTK